MAVVRGTEVITSPESGHVLRPGDTLVAVGTDTGVQQMRQLIGRGP